VAAAAKKSASGNREKIFTLFGERDAPNTNAKALLFARLT
jgi:hypothetical protein